MKAVAWRTALLLALPFLAACEDGEGPEGSTSTFVVQVYVDMDDSLGLGEGDLPVSASVTVTSLFEDLVLTDATGPDGVVAFNDLPAGSYTVSHVFVDGPAGAILDGNPSQTVVAPFDGGEVTTHFLYTLDQGTLSGVVFRDDDGSGGFESGADSVFRNVTLLLFEGTDTLGAPNATTQSGSDGEFDFGSLEQGDYMLLVRAPEHTDVAGANPRAVAITAGAPLFLEIEMTGDPTGPVVPIADARAAAEGTAVKVRGVVTAGQGTFYEQGVYIQDATGGILVFGVDVDAGYDLGDSIQVVGTRDLTPREEVFIQAVGVASLGTGILPDPQTITAAELNAGELQGRLATISGGVDSLFIAVGGFEVWMHDEAEDDALIFVDSDTGIDEDAMAQDETYTVTGIVATYDVDDDGVIDAGDYRLMPRSEADIE